MFTCMYKTLHNTILIIIIIIIIVSHINHNRSLPNKS